MPAQQISVTLDDTLYKEFEELRLQVGHRKRSGAVEEAIKLWIKHVNDTLIAEGCRTSKEDDLAMAKASRQKTIKALSRNL